jgi:hypothetical protein
MKVVEVYYFRVDVPVGYEAELLHSVEKVVPLTFGNYDRVARVSSPEIVRCRALPGANPNPATRDNLNVDAEEDDLLQMECVTVEFSIPRDDALMRSVIEDGIYPAHPWDEPGVFVYPAHEARKWET